MSKWVQPPARRDVVVFDPPDSFWELSARKADGEALIKRVVGVAGDEIEVRSGQLIITLPLPLPLPLSLFLTLIRCATAS